MKSGKLNPLEPSGPVQGLLYLLSLNDCFNVILIVDYFFCNKQANWKLPEFHRTIPEFA